MPKFRTKPQNSRMFGLASQLGLTHEDLRDYAAEVSNGRTDHTSKIYTNEADEIIYRLEQLVNSKETPRRTVSYRRQKAGVEQIVTPEHLKLMNDLWFKKPKRTQSGLESLCLRINKIEKPRTTKQCSNVIEAIKDMNKRDGIFGSFKNEKGAA